MKCIKASAYDFSAEVDRLIDSLSYEDYHLRPRCSKKLQEELYPLSRLALHFKQPGLEVEVEAFLDSGNRDGSISICGFYDREYKVEITFAGYDGESALRNELLVSEGFCPGAGEIERNKKSKSIVATMEAVDFDGYFTRIALAVLKEFHKKNKKNYESGTILLITFEDVHITGLISWSKLFAVIDENGGLSDGLFAISISSTLRQMNYFWSSNQTAAVSVA